ncbi:hypothetical protein ACJDU8_19400 [Clostridium sp. WILCCON 0269]|uniref:Carboxypeptidase regulatory-like domain-containing protein n=1 Tax=Candidatus Clostridium eludens TaxID=3381663 RepID=A0ABW8SSX6_9CLOT
MCAVVKKIISREELITKKVICKNATLPNEEYVLIKGVVYSPQRIPLPHAAIDIVQINSNVTPQVRKNIGVTFTLEDGSYGVPLLWKKGYAYELTAYSPA